MKKIFLLLGILISVQPLLSQEKFKFGNVPQDLLEMTVYEKDSSTSAFVVYEGKDVYYDWSASSDNFGIVTEYVVRIKILKQDGVEYANQAISFFKGRNPSDSDNIENLTGWTYNLEDGKIVKEKLSKDYIFTEDVTEYWKRMKFALPAVKVGSVIEYKYKKKSPRFYDPENIQFQRSIPVQYSRFIISIPEYFKFNREVKGYEPIKTTFKPTNLNFHIGNAFLNCSGEESIFEVFNLPALKEEDYVWNADDFMSGISFELRNIVITGHYYKDFSQTWEKVATNLKEYDDFGKELNNKGILKDETAAIKAMEGDDETKLRAVLDLVRNKIKWNDQNRLYITNLSKALKEGVGNSAQINALLLNALKNAGYNVCPVVMSLRSNGRIPITYPTIDNFNYFIVQVVTSEKTYYLDATRSYTDLNLLPVNCLVDRALCLQAKGFDWIDLSALCSGSNRVNLIVAFNEDGILAGKKLGIYAGESAFSFRREYNEATDEATYIQDLENTNNIMVSDYKMEEKHNPGLSCAESYDFVIGDNSLGESELIMINPLLFEGLQKNIFKSEDRKLPIEFSYPLDERINVSITIPEGYVLDEAPTSEKFLYDDDNSLEFSYIVRPNETVVQIAYRLTIKTCIVPATDYTLLRDFWSKVCAKNNQVIVFKKI